MMKIVYPKNKFLGRIATPTGVSIEEIDALLAFYEATTGSGWTNDSGWGRGDVSDWFGITVSGGHVTKISLGVNNLIGSEASTLAPLTFLEDLRLNDNAITDIDTSTFAALRVFFCSGNVELNSIDIEFNMLMEIVQAANTGLTAMVTATNTVLREVLFNFSNVSTYDNSTTPLLTTLWASGNSIPDFDFTNLFQAKSLLCNDNGLVVAEVDSTIDGIHTNRANYTDPNPVLNIGGSNAVPSVTALNQIIELTADPKIEGFNLWTITHSGTLGAEKTTNGVMELDSDWGDYGFDGGETNERSSTRAHAGTYSRHIVVDGVNEGCFQNTIALVSGTTYKVSGWAWVVSGTFRPRIYDGASIFTLALSAVSITGAWVYWEEYFVAGNTTSSGHLQLVCSSAGAEFYADNVSVKDII